MKRFLNLRQKGDADAMKDKMIKELFQLAMTATDETDDYVDFEISSYGPICSVRIMEGGFGEGKEFDGWYDLVSGDDDLAEEMRKEAFLEAKGHLERLIEKARRDRLEVAV